MNIKWLYISIIALIFSNNNVHAFSFGEYESGITIDTAIALTKKSNGKLIELENLPESTIAVKYILGDETHHILLEFTGHPRRLHTLIVYDTETNDINKLERKNKKFKETLRSIYGVPCVEKHAVAIIGGPKTVSDNPDTYKYENDEDEVSLTYSKNLQFLTLRFTWKLLDDTNKIKR